MRLLVQTNAMGTELGATLLLIAQKRVKMDLCDRGFRCQEPPWN